jgi:hypothetical protein
MPLKLLGTTEELCKRLLMVKSPRMTDKDSTEDKAAWVREEGSGAVLKSGSLSWRLVGGWIQYHDKLLPPTAQAAMRMSQRGIAAGAIDLIKWIGTEIGGIWGVAGRRPFRTRWETPMTPEIICAVHRYHSTIVTQNQ